MSNLQSQESVRVGGPWESISKYPPPADEPADIFMAKPSVLLKKKKKKKAKESVPEQENSSVGINELGDINGAEIPATEIEPEIEPVPEEPAALVNPMVDYAQISVHNEVDAVRRTPPELESAPEPLYLTFRAQHKLMIHLQQSLEAMCFAFGQKHMPEILQSEGWDCPEAVELQVWTDKLRLAQCFRNLLPQPKKRRALLSSVVGIRDHAVSRTRLDSAELEKVLVAAQEMARLIGEEKDISANERLCEEVIDTNRWLEEEKDQLTHRLDTKLSMFAAARAKVDALEETSRAAFDQGLKKRQSAAQTKVLLAIEKAEADQLADVPDRSVAPSSLDWVNGLENSLMLGEESQTEILV
ncbi:hypothetical protein FGRMN_2932 [Fusarium graminum]|nr:hypothetical protein FGRMN_2932 [Fusarium graminum]